MFLTVFANVSLILIYMLLGFLVCKSGKAKPSHAKTLSAILLFILSPAMIINSFLSIDFSWELFRKMCIYFGVTLVVQALFFAILYAIFHRRYQDARYRILSVGAVLGNVGYIGMPIISSIFPNEPIVVCYSSLNVMTMNLLVFTVGVFLITNDRTYMSLKSAILNPTTLSILVALPLYLLQVKLPQYVMEPVSLLAKMVTPMCMFILGIRLADAKLKSLVTRPFVYATCGLKLIVFPLFAYLCVRFLPFVDPVAKTTVFVLAAVPSGVVIETLAELHECEQELSANVVLMTTILCIITLPLMLTLF